MALCCSCKGYFNFSKQKHATVLLIFLLFSTRACCDEHPSASKRSNCSESERRALLAIKSDLYNSDNWLSSWTGYDCCKWRRVTCDNTTNHVSKLDLHYPIDPYSYASFPNKSKVNPSLFELKHLKYLDLSFNNFSTVVPGMISSLVHLEYLNFSNANFNGLIPQQLGNLSKLRVLDLSCYFMPWNLRSDDLSWLSHLTSLKYLNMSYVFLITANNWFRQINYNSLKVLALSNCLLQDAVGADSSTMKLNSSSNQTEGNISVHANGKLKYLDLSSNDLTRVPFDMGNLIHLEYLNFYDNQIFGEIPLSMGNLTSLIYLDMSYNAISGHIPYALCNLVYLEEIILFGNDISSEIPKNIKALSAVKIIDLSNNELSGEIPKEITKLHGLYLLNLSNNHLTGKIPENISDMIELESLDLSMNHLTGEIPLNLSSLAFLSSLNFSYNNLSGRIPRGSQLQTFTGSTYAGNKDLCGLPLRQCPGDDVNHSPFQAADEEYSPFLAADEEFNDILERILDYAFVVMGFIVGFWAYWGTILIKMSSRITIFRMVDKMYDWMYVQLALKLAKLKLKWQK